MEGTLKYSDVYGIRTPSTLASSTTANSIVSRLGYSGNVNNSGLSGISTTESNKSSLVSNLHYNNWGELEPVTKTVADGYSGITLSGNASIHYSTNQYQNNMTPKQFHVAVFTITRDVDTNQINSTKFVKELWVEQKNGTSIDLIVAKQLDKDFDPETTIIKVLSSVSF